MKIRDIIIENYDFIDLFETLTTYIPEVEWINDIGYFSIDENKYEATVVKAPLEQAKTYKKFFGYIPNIGNIDFSLLLNNNEKTQNSVGYIKQNVFKVFASVVYIACELIKKYNYDIILCAAKREHSPINFEKRASMYEHIAQRIAQKTQKSSMLLIQHEDNVVYAIYPPGKENTIIMNTIKNAYDIHIANQRV